jgi:hypothetical protein
LQRRSRIVLAILGGVWKPSAPRGYTWRKTAQQILDKVARRRAMLDALH